MTTNKMKIGLIDVDGHGKKKVRGAMVFPNLALCKLAAWHKQRGDIVTWYDPLLSGHCDIVYMSKVFNFSPDYPYPVNANQIIKGGTGYNLKTVLPVEVDDMQPDFTIYPSVPTDVSFGFLTRGCPNKCRWCVVPKKEGEIHPYWDIDKVANGKTKVVLMDNNILAAGDYCKEQLQKIIDKKYYVEFNQAMDARLVTEEYARLLAQIKWLGGRIRFGCDTHKQIKDCQRAIELINSFGYKGDYFLYTMLRGNMRECYNRIHVWWLQTQQKRQTKEGFKVYCQAQPYRDPSNPARPVPQWQKDMAFWCNKKMIYEACDFKGFQPRKNFKCIKYFENANRSNKSN